tara:strand:+ start:651 stop:1040 length:390 start_codon:yes stop_codon:yes gene_type:complete
VKGIILGFLFGCFSLALFSIIAGIIAPKNPVSVIIKAPDGSEFTNSATYNSYNSEYLNEFNGSSSGITLPTTRRSLNPDSSIESISKLDPQLHSLNFSRILKINQKMQDGPLQPKISNENTDSSVKISN